MKFKKAKQRVTNPLPENPYDFIVSFSGGIGSFVASHLLKQENPEANILLLFCDTLIEDEDLYRFLDEGATALNLPLQKIADGRTPWEVFRDVRFQGNSRTAPCSKILKNELFRAYLKRLAYKPIVVLGIDYQESERLERAQKKFPEHQLIAPLCQPPFISYDDRLSIIRNYGIQLPRLYEMGFPHNNCGGFCVRSGLAQFALLKEQFPERFNWHKEQQNQLMKDVPSANRPFLRKRKNGKLIYMTLEEFEKYQLDESETCDFGGCGCFIDEDEE